MKREPANSPGGYDVSQKVLQSFPQGFDPRQCWFRLSGPGGLVRFIQQGRSTLGRDESEVYFFDEMLFSQTRQQAKNELHERYRNQPPPGASIRTLTGLYMRLCLRQDLAVCKNWTEDFDGYAVLPLRPGDTLLALVGPIRAQPIYDPKIAKDLDLQRMCASKNINLPGGAEQFVINFTLPENSVHKTRILGPFPF